MGVDKHPRVVRRPTQAEVVANDPREISPEALAFASGADAPNTKRAYRSDINDFLRWCASKNVRPLPVSPDDFSKFLRD